MWLGSAFKERFHEVGLGMFPAAPPIIAGRDLPYTSDRRHVCAPTLFEMNSFVATRGARKINIGEMIDPPVHDAKA